MGFYQLIVTGLIGVAFAGAAGAIDSSPLEELRAVVAQQQQQLRTQSQQIEQLRAAQDQNWLNDRRVQEVKALVREVLSDADTRASLLEAQLNAGWNQGFFLSSEDGSFLLRILGDVQFRHILSTSPNAQDDATDSDSGTPGVQPTELDDTRNGFESVRTRLGLRGHVVDPSWTYFLWTGWNNKGEGFLLDAWIKKDLGNGLAAGAGQFKVPLWHEWLVSETRQQFVERTLVCNQFIGTYTQGLFVEYSGAPFHAILSVNDGVTGNNTAFTTEDAEGGGVTARLELFTGENLDRYGDFQSWPGEQPQLVVGLAGHYQQNEYGSTTDESQLLRWTVDASLELGGVNLFAAVLGNHLSDVEGVEDMDQYAFMAQVGWFLTDRIELIGRYEWGDLDVPGVEDLNLLTAGVNYYFAKHQIKVSCDVGYSFNPLNRVRVGSNTYGWSNDYTGWRADASDSDGQVVVRSMVQLLF